MLRYLVPVSLLFLSPAARAAERGHEGVATWYKDDKPGAFQSEIDKLAPGAVLSLEDRTYEGPIYIRTAGITLLGSSKSRISAKGAGTTVVIQANNVTIKGITLADSGSSYEQVHAAVSVRGAEKTKLEKLKIENSLFGIDVSNSNGVEITHSDIASRGSDLGMRGDAIRIWGSKNIVIENNVWHDARDTVSWYSENVRIVNNLAHDSRYSVHSMRTKNIYIDGNKFINNSVGIFLMYGSGATVRNNSIQKALGATGIGIGVKETSNTYMEGNSIVYCATGLLIDNSPWEPGTKNWVFKNTLAFNGTGVVFSNDRQGNEFSENILRANLADVNSENRSPSRGTWNRNVWENYDGFDRNKDGLGDSPYIIRAYGDLITSAHPMASYFYGSPVLTVISMFERIISFTKPIVLVKDAQPLLAPKTRDAK